MANTQGSLEITPRYASPASSTASVTAISTVIVAVGDAGGAIAARASAQAAQESSTSASTSASTATTQAGIATTKASEASASATAASGSASTASTKASEASDAAATATTQAGIATTKASEASASASTASTQAGIATTKANEASASATSAGGSASTATTQAGIATTQASEASNSAANALAIYGNTSAMQAAVDTATTKASEASASASTATTKASEASASAATATTQAGTATTKAGEASNFATSASGSAATATTKANEASASATSAQNSASTATTQAGIATTKAVEATSSATSASTQASVATTQAGIATTKASEASDAASTATTQAGIATTKAGEASTSAGNAATSETNAATSKTTAEHWAVNPVDELVPEGDGTQYSALHYATKAGEQAAGAVIAAGEAGVQAGNAIASAQTAQTAANNAVAVVTGGTASLTPSAGKIPLADATGKIDPTWVDPVPAVAETLHRSPNAITAMFVYDTSKDSDGGAWTEKCQHTSWYNETIYGKWLGAHDSETHARNLDATLGNELITNSGFSDGSTGWSATGDFSISNGAAFCAATASGSALMQTISSSQTGKLYRISMTLSGTGTPTGTLNIRWGSGTNKATFSAFGEQVFYLTPDANGAVLTIYDANTWTGYIDNISVKEVIALTTQTDDYFQLTTDGKFYKLNAGSGTTEVFRGNKRSFPKVAAIVIESRSSSDGTSSRPTFVIYDLAEIGRPMWMASTSTSSLGVLSYSYMSSLVYPSCACAEGVFVACAYGSNGDHNGGVVKLNFLRDTAVKYSGSGANDATAKGTYKGNIAARNSSQYDGIVTGLQLSGTYVQGYAVAMTVLPDAPTDPVTGLKVPTIAVATAGGVSIIKHDGTVVNSFDTSARSAVTISERMLTAYRPSITQWVWIGSPGKLGSSFNWLPNLTNGPGNYGAATFGSVAKSGKAYYRRPASGARVDLLRNNDSTNTKGVSSTITDTYNAGHLLGDIRRAYLADIGTGDVTGPELVTSTSQWDRNYVNTPTTVLLDSPSQFTISRDDTGNWRRVRFTGLVSGRTYRLTFTATFISGNDHNVSINGSPATGAGISNFTAGLNTFNFTLSEGYTYIDFNLHAYFTGSVSGISVTEKSADRSYKSKYSDIYGTLTKTAVNTDTDLVAYSGFSGSNYLQEPYSADLDFGTGEWSVGAWVNIPTSFLQTMPVGTELNPDPTFDVGTDWTLPTGAVITDGALRMTSVGRYTTLTLNLGATYPAGTYLLSFNSPNVTGSNAYMISMGSYSSGWVTSNIYAAPKAIESTSAFSTLGITIGGYGFTGTIDNLSIKPIPPVRIADRSATTGATISVSLLGTGKLTATAYDGTTTRTVTTSAAYNTGTWLKAEAEYTTDGALAIRVNGTKVATTTGTPLLTLNNSNAVLTIGNSYALDAPFPGSIALLKLSATVPTTEQAQWMYEQEKQLFREGAKCVLPASTSVLDLTYDDVTDTWSTLQASYESTWSGLVRTSTQAPSAGSFSKVFANSGIKLLGRTTTNPGVDVQLPAKNLRTKEMPPDTNQDLVVFDFDAVTSQTDFALPVGYTARVVYSAGAQKREGSTKDWTRLFDGFVETIRFGTAPGNAVWVQIHAVKEVA